MLRALAVIACVATLVACGQAAAPAGATADMDATAAGADAGQATSPAAASGAQASAAAAPQVTSTACGQSYEAPTPTPAFVEVFADSDNDPLAATGVLIEAPAGTTTCSGSFASGVSCQVRGPAVVRVSIQDYEYFTVPASRTATLSQGRDTTCFLNAG